MARRRFRGFDGMSADELYGIASGQVSVAVPEPPLPPDPYPRYRNQGRFEQQAGTIVYWSTGTDNKVLYVGVTDDFFGRMAAHKTSSPWWDLAAVIQWVELPDRAAGLKHEATLIRRHRPRFNTIHNPDKWRSNRDRKP